MSALCQLCIVTKLGSILAQSLFTCQKHHKRHLPEDKCPESYTLCFSTASVMYCATFSFGMESASDISL